MKIATACLLVLLTIAAYSQKEHVLLKISPLSLIDLNMPSVQAGIEFKLAKKITWYNEVGVKYAKGIPDYYSDTNRIASNGFKLKSEVRYYFETGRKFKYDEGDYVGANIFYVQEQHSRSILYRQANSSSDLTDDFGVRKKIYGFNFVYGHQESLSKKFLIDFYGGLGMRFRTINTVSQEYNSNSDTFQNATDPKISEIGENGDGKGGSSILPNVTLGFRLCYRLR
jgi:hypothetical protein